MLTLDPSTRTNTLTINSKTTMNLIISIITLSNNRQKATNQTSKEKA